MAMTLSAAKDLATIAKPIIEPLVSTFVTPAFKKMSDWLKEKGLQKKVVDALVEKKFSDFIHRTFEKCSSMNILVFPNQQINIKDIYYPLSIRSSKDNKSFQIKSFDFAILKSYKKILISDSAGMGKSTLTKWIGLTMIEQSDSIPVLIELKRLSTEHKVIDEIVNQINDLDKAFDRDVIYKFLEFGQFTILFDGFDEIQYEFRRDVIDDMKDFISKTPKTPFILTSRKEDSLSSFGDFQLFSIKPLELEESYSLIHKYDHIGKYEIAEKLVSDIKEKLTQVREFLTNPFLVSLLYKTYTYNKDIPSKKSTFYDEVYSALYKQHDLSKDHFERDKKSGLDIYDFRLVLRQFAFDTAKLAKVEYSNQEILRFLKNSKQMSGLDFKESKYLTDLETNVPLFIRDGGLVKWAHKSLQDYFAAEWISNNIKKDEVISKIYESKRSNYLNIIDFLQELEPKLFRKLVTYRVLDSFINYCDTTYKELRGVNKTSIRLRQSLTFGNSYVITPDMKHHEWHKLEQVHNRILPEYSLRSISLGVLQEFRLYEVYGTSFNQEILDLLANRNEDLFYPKQATQARGGQFPISLTKGSGIKANQTYVLNTDDPTSVFNLPANFDKFNKYLTFSSRIRLNINLPNYEKCQKFKKRIEREVLQELSADILEGI